VPPSSRKNWFGYGATTTPAKTEQTDEMQAAEKSKPLFRVSITNRETQ